MTARKHILSMIALPLVLAACSPAKVNVTEQLAKDIQNGAACENFHEQVNATLTQALMDEGEVPTSEDLRRRLEETLPASPSKAALIEKAISNYNTLTTELRQKLGLKNHQEMIEALVALEIGDETTPEKKALKTKIRQGLSSLKAEAQGAGLDCAPPPSAVLPVDDEIPVSEIPGEDKNSPLAQMSAPVRGAVRVIATAYQSCQAIRLPAMTASTDSLHSKAIKITGTHSNGVGMKRVVGDLKLLQQTHYYVREGIENDSSCFNVTKSPLIYDYGGKPYATNTDGSALNFFKNAGSGTEVLGFDCSGYIFSALAASGLRLSPGKKLKAFQVNGVSARMYMDPANNGLSCLAPVASTKANALQNGDILATTGHIVMVDQVGSDPFGIARLRSVSDCKTANISSGNFDFDILQSAPIKNGIGINRVRASHYLDESASMRQALVEYAVAACKARFGQTSTVKPSSGRLVRHKQTAECKDKAVPLERESCVRSCVANL